MAQIFVFGRVMNDLVPKESQSKQSYVCFDLMERTKNWTQFYQVWAWDADVTRLMQFKVKKGSMIWLVVEKGVNLTNEIRTYHRGNGTAD